MVTDADQEKVVILFGDGAKVPYTIVENPSLPKTKRHIFLNNAMVRVLIEAEVIEKIAADKSEKSDDADKSEKSDDADKSEKSDDADKSDSSDDSSDDDSSDDDSSNESDDDDDDDDDDSTN